MDNRWENSCLMHSTRSNVELESALYNKPRSMSVKCLVVLPVIILSLISCSARDKGLRELARLCEKDAGFTLYSTAAVDGYYNSSGTVNIVSSPYAFFEYCKDTAYPSHAISETGCFRLTKVDRASGNCHEGLDARLSSFKADPYPDFLSKNCIAVDKIEKPTTKYGVYDKLEKWRTRNGKSSFHRVESYIAEVESGDVLSRYVTYTFDFKPKLSAAVACDDLSNEYPAYASLDLPNRVLKPLK